MSITDRVENPFTSKEFRATTLGLSSMAERLAIERLINQHTIDWRNATTDLKTSGGGEFTEELTGVDQNFSGTSETAEAVIGRLGSLDGGDYTTQIEIIDLWGAVHIEQGLDGGDYLSTPLGYVDGGRYIE